jgi:hypothetical protein
MSFVPPMDLGFTPSTKEPARFGSPPLLVAGQRRRWRRWLADRIFRV